MKKIGGFFELELAKGKSIYHDDAILLTTGRACLNYILQSKQPTKVYIPFYCCNALIDPMVLNSIEYAFYTIDEHLEIKDLPELKPSEAIIYCDFFGIKTEYTNNLIKHYKNQLIVDNTHSFFSKGYETTNASFTSARKYFGVPDGAFLYISDEEKIDVEINRNLNVSIEHNMHSLLGEQQKAYGEYVAYEKTLGSAIEQISVVSERLLSMVDYKEVRQTRNENYNFYAKELKELNQLNIDAKEQDCFCYPLLLKEPLNRQELYKEQIFIPSLWLDTTGREGHEAYELECKLSTELLPLPIDHRYSTDDLKRVCDFIKKKAKR
ncbi:MAG: hypothetical protein GY810_14645 [Aureispira sp.]|nr:hypothetical protein [Aureispira sp.]